PFSRPGGSSPAPIPFIHHTGRKRTAMPREKPCPTATPNPALERRRRLQKLRSRLQAERAGWTRWMARLKRAFHAVVKIQDRVARDRKGVTKVKDAGLAVGWRP